MSAYPYRMTFLKYPKSKKSLTMLCTAIPVYYKEEEVEQMGEIGTTL